MNASSWSLRNLPWFKATLAQWRYALRNTIAMCLALTVAYYLNLDEPYWAMTSAAVVSFPTVGGVISKSLGRIAGSLLGAIAAPVRKQMLTPSHVLSPRYARPTSPTTGTSPSGSDYVIFAAFICKVVRNYIVCKAV